MTWPWQWAVASNERAVDNARLATTALSRGRVERDEVELFLLERYAEPTAESVAEPAAVPVDGALDGGAARAAR